MKSKQNQKQVITTAVATTNIRLLLPFTHKVQTALKTNKNDVKSFSRNHKVSVRQFDEQRQLMCVCARVMVAFDRSLRTKHDERPEKISTNH